MRAKMYVYFFGFGAAGSVSSGSAPPETAQKYKAIPHRKVGAILPEVI